MTSNMVTVKKFNEGGCMATCPHCGEEFLRDDEAQALDAWACHVCPEDPERVAIFWEVWHLMSAAQQAAVKKAFAEGKV